MLAIILQANAAFQLKIEDFMFHIYLGAALTLPKSLSLVDNVNILTLAACR